MTYKISKYIYPDGTFWRVFMNGYLCGPPGLKFEDNKFATEEAAIEATLEAKAKIKTLRPFVEAGLADLKNLYGCNSCNEIEIENTPENLALVKEFSKANGENEEIQLDRNGKIVTLDFINLFVLEKILNL